MANKGKEDRRREDHDETTIKGAAEMAWDKVRRLVLSKSSRCFLFNWFRWPIGSL
jgi:hypothetical protein